MRAPERGQNGDGKRFLTAFVASAAVVVALSMYELHAWLRSLEPAVGGILLVAGCGAIAILLRKIALMRQAADEATHLREVNRLMRIAEEAANIGYWQVDLRTGDITWSDEVYRIRGVPTTHRPKHGAEYNDYESSDRKRVAEIIERAFQAGTAFQFESRIVRPDGTLRDVVVIGQQELAANGTPIGIIGAFQDITERKDAERERDRLITRIALTNRAGKTGIWDWDLRANTVLWDENMFALRGRASISHAEISDRILFDTMHPEDIQRVRLEVAQSLATTSAFDTEFRVVWTSGEVHYLRSQGTVIRDVALSALRMVGTDWDITEVRSLAEQLHQEKELVSKAIEQCTAAKEAADRANREKIKFFQGIRREIRTPLNGIIGLTAILLDGTLTPEQRLHVTSLADAGHSLLTIMNDVLDVSDVEAQLFALEVPPADEPRAPAPRPETTIGGERVPRTTTGWTGETSTESSDSTSDGV